MTIREGNHISYWTLPKRFSAIMVSGHMPDPVRFLGAFVASLKQPPKQRRQSSPGSSCVGEGVAILQAEGKANAAIRLEQLCDELAKTHKVDVLCAHPLNSFQTVEH